MNRSLGSAIRARIGRCRELCLGIRHNLQFSNGLQLNFQRLFRRSAAEVVYVWDKRIRIACDCARGEHFGVHEVFTHRCYAPHLDRCHFAGNRIRFVDVGANVGAFGLWLSTRGLAIESGIAAELNPVTYQRCRRNLANNDFPTVRVVNCGVAESDGWIDFVPAADALGDNIFSGVKTAVSPGQPPLRVERVSLATLLQRHAENRRSFDLLKLDCEGAEYQILRATPAEVLRAFRYLIVEFHAEPVGESLDGTLARLHECGFVNAEATPAARPFVGLWTREQ